ncbi:inositol polyphosphate kinase 2 alpha [Striga asiatica]|uniref:Inositol polyphosphate kinase 2 alpha n=1 Tax=Striga asiatica TaxID=4170 RepID=A0A5A7PKC6_STRAF|nr:inositol polyphosphate kinase 2 alpha [Striga asiatica]
MALSRVDLGENSSALRRMRRLGTDKRLRCKVRNVQTWVSHPDRRQHVHRWIETEEQNQASCVNSKNKQASSPKKNSKPSTMEEAAVEFLLESLKKTPHDQGRFDQKRQDPGRVAQEVFVPL